MALWDKQGKRPFAGDRTADKRNVIATKAGWVRRLNYTDVHSNVRTKDIPLVAIGNLSSEVKMGNPDIVEVYTANSSGGTTLKKGRINYVYVVFTEALSIGASASPFRLTVANTISGNVVIATSNTNKASIINANNTLVFKFKGPSTNGTYKIQAQNLANTAQAKVYSVLGGTSETVNTNISATVSNTLSTFVINS